MAEKFIGGDFIASILVDQGTKEFTKVTLFLPIKEQVEDLNVTEDGFFRTDELKAEDLLNLLEDVSSRLEARRVLRSFQKSLQEMCERKCVKGSQEVVPRSGQRTKPVKI